MRKLATMVIGVLIFPFRLIGRALWGGLSRLFGPFLGRVDQSAWLSEQIDSLSSAMATQRGMPIMVGTGMLVVSFVTHGLVVMLLVATDDFSGSLYWLCIPFTLLHIGLLAGFTGIMLATPLGQGYKDK